MPDPIFIARGSPGLLFGRGATCERFDGVPGEDYRDVRGVEFSADGGRLAWVTSQHVRVAETAGWTLVLSLPITKVGAVRFSPAATYLAVWRPYFVDKDGKGADNMFIYELATQKCVKSLIHKNYKSWEVQWTADERLCARIVTNEVQLFEPGDFDSVKHKLRLEGVADYALTRGEPGVQRPPHICAFLPSTGGRPAGARLFKFPNLDEGSAVARKSFFNATTADMRWNRPGTACLVLTSADVDNTGQSYYGSTAVYCLDTRANTVHLQPAGGKKVPIYDMQWSPQGTQFVLVYGFMPSAAALYNAKCETLFEFPAAHRNSAFFSPHGGLLALAGFGNLRGRLEVWDVQAQKLVASGDCPDTTELHWCPDGRHFSAATCAPRLRQGNGFRMWHYTLKLVYEKQMAEGSELYETYWQPAPEGTFPPPVIGKDKVEGIKTTQAVSSKTAYVPPALRGLVNAAGVVERKQRLPPGMAPPEPEKKSKSKNKKKAATPAGGDATQPAAQSQQQPQKQPQQQEQKQPSQQQQQQQKQPQQPAAANDAAASVAPADRKRRRENIKKKLKDISKLKTEQAAGKQLTADQLEKLGREAELAEELRSLAL